MTDIKILVSSLIIFISFFLVPSQTFIYHSYYPVFEKQVIKEHVEDSYWIEAFQPDSNIPIGFITYGLAEGEIKFYSNPYNTTADSIEPTHIQKLVTPIAIDQADISGDGFNDIIICFDYGNTIADFDVDGGKIVWLENPGKNFDRKFWQSHYVGKSPTMHRLKIGHFTQNQRWEIIGLPIVNGLFDVPVPVLLYTQPDNVTNAESWNQEFIDQHFFHIIHEATKVRFGALDSLVVASREGLNWIHYDESMSRWIIDKIADGEQGQRHQTNYAGSGGVSVGKTGEDRFAYIAALEPFHGNVVSVYIKSSNHSLKEIQWQRYVLDIYGHPDQNGEGPGHYVICADFDQDGEDEFLVALRGPFPNQGVYYYKLIDRSNGQFVKWKISNDSTARIAIADYDNDGYLDFATVGYSVRGYYMAEKAPINIFYNRFMPQLAQNSLQSRVEYQNDELWLTVPRPKQALQYEAIPFITIGGITLSLEVLPPFSSRIINRNTYIKILSGMIFWTDSSNLKNDDGHRSRTFLCEPKRVCSLAIHSDDQRMKTKDDGAVFISMQIPGGMKDQHHIDHIQKILSENSLPDRYSDEARRAKFQFVKVDQLEWGKEKFKGVEFYNMRGFNVEFSDNGQQLVHMQLWAAGKGTNAGVHNHFTDRFCEVHTTIINGNGKSGIQYIENSEKFFDPNNILDSDFVHLDMPSFYEHGPLWNMDTFKRPALRADGTVIYPWHKWQSGFGEDILRMSDDDVSVTSLINKNIDDDRLNQSYDVWIAFEFNPDMSILSK